MLILSYMSAPHDVLYKLVNRDGSNRTYCMLLLKQVSTVPDLFFPNSPLSHGKFFVLREQSKRAADVCLGKCLPVSVKWPMHVSWSASVKARYLELTDTRVWHACACAWPF